MGGSLRSVLLATAGLGLLAAAALALTALRTIVANGPPPHRAVRLAGIAVALQALHFAEELATGFPRRLPELLGLAPWPPAFFPAFNLAWLAAWLLALGGLARRRRAALFPLWFLALAGLANGLAHPLLALRSGGYFPGLLSAPLVGVAGAFLLRSLWRLTAADPGAPPGA